MIDNSYSEFLELVKFRQKDMEYEELDAIRSLMEMPPVSFNLFQLPFFVLDYTAKNYKVFSKPVIGYHPQQLIEDGLDFVIDIYHPKDFEMYGSKIFNRAADLLKATPQEDHVNLLFTYTYRLRKTNGEYAIGLQKCKYITDKETNMPLYSFGILIDLNGIKKDSSMVFKVEKERGGYPLETVLDLTFFPELEDGPGYKARKAGSEATAEGLPIKQIASKLHISENTVANHRKNLLRKTQTSNVAELIKFAIANGLI